MVHDETSKLQALTDISSIDITLEFDQILENILRITCETMHAHSGTMMLVDDDTRDLFMVASYNLGPDYIRKVNAAAEKAGVPLSASPSGTVLSTGKVYLVPNIFEEPKDEPWYDLTREMGFSAQIYGPMKRGPKVIGILIIYMPKPHEFTENEINFVTIAASQATSVVQNARICSRLKDNIHELNEYKEHLEEKIKKTYKALYDSENYLKSIIRSSIDGITVVDEQGNLEYGNDSLFNILEWPPHEIIGASFEKILPEDMIDLAHREWDEVKKGLSNEFELSIKTQTGKIKYVNIAHSLTEIKGSAKVVSVVKDITEHKRLEMELEDSEAKFKELFENAQEGLCTIDTQGRFITINHAALEMFGCRKEDIIGTRFSDWLAPECSEIAETNFMKLLAGYPVQQLVIREIVRLEGGHRWIELKVRPIKDGAELIGFHGMFNDITDKKNMEIELRYYNEKLRMSFEKLKIAEVKYRDLFENAQDPMYIIDTGGYFRKMNKIGLAKLGCTEAEFVGSHVSKWVTPESLRKVEKRLEQRMRGENPKQPEILEIISKNGEHFFIETHTRLITDIGEVTGIHGIARDITEKRHLEKKLAEIHAQIEKSYEELKETDKLKTEFIANITHELLTPLTSIKGFSELLKDEKIGKINQEQEKSLKAIIRNSDRLAQLIRDLIAVSQYETSRFDMKFEPVLINNIISKTVAQLEPQALEKHISINQELQPALIIHGDEARLTQAMVNLLDNAIKFTPENKDITINAAEHAGEINVQVIDSGSGIPPDKLPHIFDKFYQVDGSISREYGGMGLGLSISKTIIERHKGTICATSDERGSTFHITLPKNREEHDKS